MGAGCDSSRYRLVGSHHRLFDHGLVLAHHRKVAPLRGLGQQYMSDPFPFYFLKSSKSTAGQALSRSYGRFFDEFLSEESLVPLGLLALSTCVGLRYGVNIINLRSFSGKPLQKGWLSKNLTFLRFSNLVMKDSNPDFPGLRLLE